MFKYDIHVHTSETSPCGRVFAKDAVHLYKDSGYNGICITDHYNQVFFKNQSGSHRDHIDAFLKGYRIALHSGNVAGLHVMLGMEIKLHGTGNNEYLVYGMTENFLYENPKLYELDLLSLSKKIREAGMMLYQAHPLRSGMVPVERGLIDGLEAYNGNLRHNSRNEEIMHYANQHMIPVISGSDFHEIEDLAHGGIVTDTYINSNDMLLTTLRSNNYQLIQTYVS